QLWANLFDNKKTYEMMDALVEEERPDLIIMPGDNVSGLATKSLLKKLISKMESYEIPWAPTYGNHDMEGVASIQWQSKRYESAKYCLFERGEEDLYGMGNYSISISENGEIVYTLMFMDNGRYIKYEDGSKREIYISEEQTEWYEREMKKISSYNKKQTPSMLFSHFAMPEMRTAIENLSEIGEDGYFYVPNEQGSGYCKYLPCAAPVNKGFIDRAKNVGLTHVFCGHDHENNASVFYQGITYTYGLKTGCSPRYWNDADSYGATVITIGENINFYNTVKWTAK
ncbi:MAG: metallophosphoesterase, partial [Clostridia bacterium]|nr:metallophosphoesterase [Clostridia bacterium]